MYEVFDPRDGTPVFRTRFQLVARIVARLRRGFHDYALEGDGW